MVDKPNLVNLVSAKLEPLLRIEYPKGLEVLNRPTLDDESTRFQRKQLDAIDADSPDQFVRWTLLRLRDEHFEEIARSIQHKLLDIQGLPESVYEIARTPLIDNGPRLTGFKIEDIDEFRPV